MNGYHEYGAYQMAQWAKTPAKPKTLEFELWNPLIKGES